MRRARHSFLAVFAICLPFLVFPQKNILDAVRLAAPIVFDGKEHPVDSKPVAFEIAGREAFKLAVQDAGPVLFEPIMLVHVYVPDAHMGDVMSDLNTRRGRVQGTETERGTTTVIAHVPLAEMLRYTTQIRSITGGRGYFTMEFDHYETVPSHIAAPIIEAHKKEMEAKKEE